MRKFFKLFTFSSTSGTLAELGLSTRISWQECIFAGVVGFRLVLSHQCLDHGGFNTQPHETQENTSRIKKKKSKSKSKSKSVKELQIDKQVLMACRCKPNQPTP